MATVQDQENEHRRRFDHGSCGNKETVSMTIAPGGPQGCSNQGNDKLYGSERAKDCWRKGRLEALVSTGTVWEHVLQRGACRKWVRQRLEWLSGGNASIDLQVISKEEQLWLDAAAEETIWTDRVLWPRVGKDIQHIMTERAHDGLVEEDGWNKRELGPRVAIIASGQCSYAFEADPMHGA